MLNMVNLPYHKLRPQGRPQMNQTRRTRLARTTTIAALSTLSLLAQAQTPANEFLKDVQVSGFLDLYYQYSGNQPPAGTFLAYRNFDVRDDSLQIAAAVLSLVKAPNEKSPFGFTVNLLAGKDADLETAGEPNGSASSLKYLHQGYVTYALPKGGLTVDLGKFQTWIGLESPFAAYNDLYSLSFVFTLGQPTYHLGLRATKTLDKAGGTFALYGVNGWNEADDSNRGKSYGASLSHPIGKLNASLNYYGGTEGSAKANDVNGFTIANVGEQNVQLADLVLSTQITPKIKLAANADYAAVNRVRDDAPHGHYTSYDILGRYQFSRSFGVTARYDNFFDPDGVRSGFLASGARFNSVALGAELLTGTASSLRFEVRHDESNRDAFEGEDGAGTRRARTTFTLAHIFRF